MTNISNSIQKFLIPFAVGVMMVGGALAMTAPAFVGNAHAQNEITSDELLPSEFSGETGLGNQDLKTTVGRIVRAALTFLGVIALVIVLYGGFVWMTAQGDETKIKKAQGIIVSGSIGLAIILSAAAITTFVLGGLIDATTSGPAA